MPTTPLLVCMLYSQTIKLLKKYTIVTSRIQLPNDIFRITSPGSRRVTFTTNKVVERVCLERKDRKAKLEVRALRKAETRLGFKE